MRKGYLITRPAPQYNWTKDHGGVTNAWSLLAPELLEDVSPVHFEDVLAERHVEMRTRYDY